MSIRHDVTFQVYDVLGATSSRQMVTVEAATGDEAEAAARALAPAAFGHSNFRIINITPSDARERLMRAERAAERAEAERLRAERDAHELADTKPIDGDFPLGTFHVVLDAAEQTEADRIEAAAKEAERLTRERLEMERAKEAELARRQGRQAPDEIEQHQAQLRRAEGQPAAQTTPGEHARMAADKAAADKAAADRAAAAKAAADKTATRR